MEFFDFEDDFFEAASAPASKPPARPAAASSTAKPKGSSGTPGSGSGPTKPSSGPSAPASGRPARPGAAAPTAAAQTGRDGRTPPPATTPAPARPSDGGGGFSFDRVMPYLTQGFDVIQKGAQIAQQFRPAPVPSSPVPGGPAPGDAAQPGADGQVAAPQPSYDQPGLPPQPSGYDVGPVPQPYGPGPASQPTLSADQLGILLQALRQRQIPPLPGQPPPTAVPSAPVAAAPSAPAVPQADALALLRLILSNPQFQQSLQLAALMGSAGPRTMELPVPRTWPPRRQRPVSIPLGAVMNAISVLAGQSMSELNARTSEDDPEVPSYLVDEEGEFVVDPASSDDRAALVAHLFRVSDEARRSDWDWSPDDSPPEAADEMDESDAWAREAGFLG